MSNALDLPPADKIHAIHERIVTSNQGTEPDIRTPEVFDSAFRSIGNYREIFDKLARK